ncbi:MAG TPA: hypothetical protein VFN09_11150 [Rhodanobacteraceae bacterium]|nr:hypothetical protein [Rhodanobacteraceae bacterium]
MKAGFFAIGAPQWAEACKLGLNPAVAYLVAACGTGRDNITTRWSAEAVRKYTGMGRLRAKDALNRIDGNAHIVASVAMKGGNPARKLTLPDTERLLWLPNALVTGARDEVPPVAKLRQSQNLEHLQTFIELYGMQDLAGDGGLSRSLVRAPFKREQLCEQGPFIVYGFNRDTTRTCWNNGPLARFAERKEGEQSAAWACLTALENMGLLEKVDYLAESDSPDAELLHPLTGDDDAEAVKLAAWDFATELPDGFKHEAEQFDYVLPVLRHIGNPAVVGVSRLVYRPHTQRTAAWFAQHREACEGYKARYDALAAGDFTQAARAC